VALSYVVDTSVLKRLSVPAVRGRVEPLVAAGALGRTAISDLEVGYPARNADEWDELMAALDAFESIETTAAHIHRALQVQRLLASKSQRGRKIPDLLVAAAAEELGATVLHFDADFDRIGSVTGQRCEWVVRAGTID
jgi:predicted nucleic acid-binding protein